MQEYKNKKGIKFFIGSEPASVPSDANYFGYYFTVVAIDNNKPITKHYKAMIEKRICPSIDQANTWLYTIALDFLYTILETYDNGNTLMLLPAADGWYVI